MAEREETLETEIGQGLVAGADEFQRKAVFSNEFFERETTESVLARVTVEARDDLKQSSQNT